MGSTPFIRELQARDPLAIFAALEHLPYSLLFDSADRNHPDARYSFIVSHPIETIESKDGEISKMSLAQWQAVSGLKRPAQARAQMAGP